MPASKKVILFIDTSHAYARGLLEGIANYSGLFGPWMFYTSLGQKGQTHRKLKQWNADGIIIRETHDQEILEKLLSLQLPTIIAPHSQRQISGLPNIIGDGLGAGKIAAEYLLDRGFRKFAFCGMSNSYWSDDRFKGFEHVIKQSGLDVQNFTLKNEFTEKSEKKITEWLLSLPKPNGMLACNDEKAHYIVELCNNAGINVPDEIAVLGIDNDQLVCSLTKPALSSVAINQKKAGFEAAKLLDRLMSGEYPEKQTIIASAVRVITRGSTDVIAVDDADVSKAVKYIRENAQNPIQVTDVLENASFIGRRALEKKFRKHLNRTIYEEIKKVRIKYISDMLLDSNFSVYQIAIKFGYSSPAHIARYFRQATGVNPEDFRKSNSELKAKP
ncbi:XylR family transcriptional regulator [Sedimentisphaera salicampi]|uniref:Xylose operon regulatory protein n=1 Tax=Sedimentisphaera salicampi TaxID=1941349 RepID=A0A1W6LKW7_9BACT|nr:DNA-binding transcriptional regulator [Sedimentisphaera salicampi]ARN56421.1 Xylose operon regulatory protein [Sedimentisphaera salicampi]